MTTTVLSVRVRKEIVEEARKLGVDLRKTVEEALIAEIRRRKIEELEKAVMKGLKAMEKVSDEEWVKTVKEVRLEDNI